MINDKNMFELSDEQLAEVAGGSLVSNVGNPVTQIGINNSVQLNVALAPTIGIAVGGKLDLTGAHLNLGNGGLLGNINKNL
jgi:hypothetical protein